MKSQWLWHPDSPGMRVLVVRGWFKRAFYPKAFATLGEAIIYSQFSNAIFTTEGELAAGLNTANFQ